MKKFLLFIFVSFMALLTPLLSACDISNNNKLISLNTYTSQLVETKTTYYVGDSFSPSLTYVNLTYYNKEENTEWTLKDYSLTKLSNKIPDIKYTIDGFDSSIPTDNQTVSIVISSDLYSGEVSAQLTIKILPEYVVNAEIINSSTSLKDCFSLNEVLDYDNFKIQNTYSNGRTEIIDVTDDMVTGFDTSIASIQKKTLQITQNNFTISHDYTVVPSDDYIIFNKNFVKCFVPSASCGFTPSQTESNVFNYYNGVYESVDYNYENGYIIYRASSLGKLVITQKNIDFSWIYVVSGGVALVALLFIGTKIFSGKEKINKYKSKKRGKVYGS